MEDRTICFLCTNELDIKTEVGEVEAVSLDTETDPSLIPHDVDFFCGLLGLDDPMVQRKLSNLVPNPCKRVHYCSSCTLKLSRLRDMVDELNSLIKRIDEFKESINQLFVRTVPSRPISGWTNKLRNFIVQVIHKKYEPLLEITTSDIDQNPATSTSRVAADSNRYASGTGLWLEEDQEAETPHHNDPDPDWFPEFEEEIDIGSVVQEPEETVAINPCYVKLTRLRLSQTSPIKYIIPEESLSMKRKRRLVTTRNLRSRGIGDTEDFILPDFKTSKSKHINVQKTFLGARIRCPITECDKSFSAAHPEILTAHVRKVHQGKDKPYSCGKCSQEFYTLLQLRKHRFETKHRKTQERAKHKTSKSKPLKVKRSFVGARIHCPVAECDKSFSTTHQESLNAHVRKVHEGKDKPYNCGKCFQEFYTYPQLRKHRFETKHRKAKENTKTSKSKPIKVKRTFVGARIHCPIAECHKSFSATHQEILTAHVRKVHEGKDKPYSCGKCFQEFYTYPQLRKHRFETKHRKTKEKVLKSKDRQRKIKFVHPEKRVCCPYCDCNVSYNVHHPRMLSYHIRKVHEGNPKPFNCSRCQEEFLSLSLLQKHRNESQHTRRHFPSSEEKGEIEPENTIYCSRENCTASFEGTHPELLEYHVREFHDGHPKPYRCDKCPEEFSLFSELEQHKLEIMRKKAMQGMERVEDFKCTCGRFFASKQVLEQHLKLKGDGITCNNALGLNSFIDPDVTQTRRFVCGVCSGRYASRKALEGHLLSHTNEKNHICEMCGSSFKSKGSLISHQRALHTEAYIEQHSEPLQAQRQIKKLTCDICGKVSSQPLQAKTHRLTHTDQYLVYCPECNLGFNSAGGLRFHVLTHKDTKDFRCEQCGREFTRKDKLKKHIERVHEAVRHAICEFCNKGFFDNFALKRHTIIVHEERAKVNQFHCIPCGKSFCTKDYLSIHNKTQKHKAAVEHINNFQ